MRKCYVLDMEIIHKSHFICAFVVSLPTAKKRNILMINRPILRQNSSGMQFLLLLCLMLIFGLFSILLSKALGIIFWGEAITAVRLSKNLAPDQINYQLMVQAINQLGLLLAPALVLGFMASKSTRSYFKIERIKSYRPVRDAVALMIIIAPTISFLTVWNASLGLPWANVQLWMSRMEELAAGVTAAFLSTKTVGGLLVNIAVIAIIPAVSEEFFFRGVVLRLCRQSLRNIHLAVFVSALIFSAFHMQFFGFLPRLVLGMILGYLFIYSQSIWIPILAHFLNNATVVVGEWIYQNGWSNTPMEEFGSNPNIWLTLGSVLFTVGLLWMIRRDYYRTLIETIGEKR